MSHLEEYLERLRSGLRRLGAAERDAVVAEVRDHLRDEANDLRRNDPTLSVDDAVDRAIERFGSPEEVAAGYDDQTGEVRRGGEVMLRVTKAVGRGAGRAALGLGKTLAILLFIVVGGAFIVAVAALLFAGGVVDTFQDDIRESIPRPLYGYDQTWSGTTEAQADTATETFDVRTDTKEFHISFDVDADTGCARIVLLDPGGAIRYDSDNVCADTMSGRDLVFSTPGRWSIQYTYTAFTGSVDVEAWYFEQA